MAEPRQPETTTFVINTQISREEFEALKAEIQQLKEMLLAAKDFDKMTGQADCEQGDKVALIKKLAELVGVDMDDVFS